MAAIDVKLVGSRVIVVFDNTLSVPFDTSIKQLDELYLFLVSQNR